MMKKLFVLGMLLSMSAGCGRSWLPCLYRGAPCNGQCAAVAHNNCENCPNVQSGYESYGDSGAMGSETYGGGYIGNAPGQVYENVPMSPMTGTVMPGVVNPK